MNTQLYPLNREEILRKLPRTIFQESANVSINQTLLNLLKKNRAEKVGGRKRKRKENFITEEIPQEEQQSGLSMQRFCRIIEWWEQRWRRWSYYQQNVQDPLDRTDGKMWRLGSVQYMRWYVCPMCYDKRHISVNNFFLVFGSDHKYLGQISIQLSLRRLIMQWSYYFKLLYRVKIFQFFVCVFTWNRPSTTQKFKLRCSFIRMVSFHGNLY